MSRFTREQIAGVAALTTAGIPIASAAYLRLKYGPRVFQDLADIRRMSALLKTLQKLKDDNVQLSDLFEENARVRPEKAAILYGDEVYNYGDLNIRANQLANFVRRCHVVQPKETVAIFMLNEPDFIISWLAFSKLGLRIAFLNSHLRGDVLLHCIKTCNTKAVICGKDPVLLEALKNISSDLRELGVIVWVPVAHDTVSEPFIPQGFIAVDTRHEIRDTPPMSLRRSMANHDAAVFIFTSGTTGLPKAAKISHFRLVSSSQSHSASIAMREDDISYVTLPLYHSAAFNLNFSGIVRAGGTLVLSNFSVRRFWHDVRKYRVTIIPYIGEMCRYLIAQPARPDDGMYDHTIRYAIGNGLAIDIWEEFKTRFNIPRIFEFYGSTEGTFGFINVDGKTGSVGRYSPLLKAIRDNLVLVQCDLETAQPLRGPDGKCILTRTGEAGLALGRLNDRIKFDGYVGQEHVNQAKLVSNVKAQGDLFFNTGDLLLQDEEGYLYFKDRLGDTFRWKGENVATTEVAKVVNTFPGIQECNVYGVAVLGHDGRAGMAAIRLLEERPLDLQSFYDHVTRSLPLYACPKFLRIMKEMDITGTFKHKKTDLAKEGFDPKVVSDPVFYMDSERSTYSVLDERALNRVLTAKAKL